MSHNEDYLTRVLMRVPRDEMKLYRPRVVALVNESETLDEFAGEVLNLLDIEICESCASLGDLELGPLVSQDGETHLCGECADTFDEEEL